MLFFEFADVFEQVLVSTSLNEITSIIESLHISSGIDLDELQMWFYLFSTMSQKFKLNDKHLLTVFCKIHEPHIDRKNLQEEFKRCGVAKTCGSVAKIDDNSPSLTLVEVYKFLETLLLLPTKSSVLLKHFKEILPKCDLKSLNCIINLIRNTNKTNKSVVKKRNLYLFKLVFAKKTDENIDCVINCVPGKPIEPMLAQPCKSFDVINFKTLCLEIKHDGERTQIHKFNNTVSCYKRNLNINYKCQKLIPLINHVLRDTDSVILDCELVSASTIVVFDVIYHDGNCLIQKSLRERKGILAHIMRDSNIQMYMIESFVCDNKNDAVKWMKSLILNTDIEGIVVKCWDGAYEPKKKKWLKIKKCYFENVCSADLVVVGGWKVRNSCNKRIIIYLVAAPFYDYHNKKWMFLPVSKVKLAKYNLEKYMEPYNDQDWLYIDDYLMSIKKIPNMVAKDPFSMPVWEMEGDFIRNNRTWTYGEFKSNYVSIRLPRFIRVRHDKNFESANRLMDLKLLCDVTRYDELNDWYLRNNIKNTVAPV
ncbi:DNA ligase [Epinotia aporema granulovirus]|uniref:DNA ligase n=1 Tax=Epinotia aporema granulovirus TaxID=166056 RepID=K4EQU4_9BBAC|nr:DNA ligase [Epinotia aporema granulovirus]AER41541.1 DNA ligase [Epinotia aporema granulovirus]